MELHLLGLALSSAAGFAVSPTARRIGIGVLLCKVEGRLHAGLLLGLVGQRPVFVAIPAGGRHMCMDASSIELHDL